MSDPHLSRFAPLTGAAVGRLRHLLPLALAGRGTKVLRTVMSRARAVIERRPLNRPGDPASAVYWQWIAENEPTAEEFAAQRQWSQRQHSPLVFSIVTPLWQTPLAILEATARSVRAQTYPHWQWCLAVSRDDRPRLRRAVEKLAAAEPRVSVVWTERNEGISHQSNAALSAAHGEFVVLLDHDDLVAAHVLYEGARRIGQVPESDLVYSDEDHITADGSCRYALSTKPDWSPEMFLGHNYICHLAAIRRTLVEELGGFRAEYDGAQDWELLLRLTERTERIQHIPKCLYYWRALPGSCSSDLKAKPYALDAQRRAVRDHLRRRGIEADVETQPTQTQRVRWETDERPLVSIIIPNRDQPRLLRRCLRSLRRRTNYRPLEIIVVDNDSSDPRVLDYYRRLTDTGAAQIVAFPGKFNYSAACNAGAKVAQGELLLFLNNDTEAIDGDWLSEMVQWATLDGVGVVGPQLRFPDGRIQHAGMALGLQAACGHLFYNHEVNSANQCGTPNQYRNVMALTGACHLMRREVYDRLGGYDEAYQLAYSDCALCVEGWLAGLRNVYTPYAVLVHHEGATRRRHVPRADERRFVDLLARNQLINDPYFPSAVDASSSHGSLRLYSAPSSGDVILHCCEEISAERPTNDAADKLRRIWRHRLDVRRAFPQGLLPSGWQGLKKWFRECGAAEHGTPPDGAIEAFADEMTSRFEERLAETYLLDPQWQQRFPLAPTAFDRGAWRCWACREGHAASCTARSGTESGQLEQLLTPTQQLRIVARHNPQLAKLLTNAAVEPEAAQQVVDWVRQVGRQEFALSQEWIARFDDDVAAGGLQQAGVNLIGHLGYQAGLGEAARGLRRAISAAGVGQSARNIPHTINVDRLTRIEEMGLDVYDTNLVVVQPDAWEHHLRQAGTRYRETNYNIGHWTWELEAVPDAWREVIDKVDEIWAPTEFVADAFRATADVPVTRVPYCVEMEQLTPFDRRLLGIPDDHFLFLFVFDNSSVMMRKNPSAVVEAFSRAFDVDDRATLLLKVGRAEHDGMNFAHLRRQAGGRSIRFLTTPLSRARCNGLLAACDCYVSLHRSEGFGLSLAEAMLLGKPVIATAYSGNMDFMTPENGMLVDYKLTPVPEGLPFYKPGPRWAEPSVDHAAEWMRWAYENRRAAADIGRAGREHIVAHYSRHAVGKLIAERLATIAGRSTAGRAMRKQRVKLPVARRLPLEAFDSADRAAVQ